MLLGHERVPEVLLRLIRSLVLGAPKRYLLFQAGRDNLGLLDGRGRLILTEPLWSHEALRGRLRASCDGGLLDFQTGGFAATCVGCCVR